jgi:hypothetical protein
VPRFILEVEERRDREMRKRDRPEEEQEIREGIARAREQFAERRGIPHEDAVADLEERWATQEDEWDMTPEEIEELKAHIAEARRNYEEGRYYTMEEARQLLEAKRNHANQNSNRTSKDYAQF